MLNRVTEAVQQMSSVMSKIEMEDNEYFNDTTDDEVIIGKSKK